MKNGDMIVCEAMLPDREGLAEILFEHYFDNKKADEPNIEKAYKGFCHSLLDVDPYQIDEIMGAVAELCMEHERAGFLAGSKILTLLMRELSE